MARESGRTWRVRQLGFEAVIELLPWTDGDLWVVERCLSDADMMEHLGGPQSREQILDAHRRYLAAGGKGTGQMFKVVRAPLSEVIGTIGYWDKTWQDELVYETGWMIFPEYQGRGLASDAVAVLVAHVRRDHMRRFLHAFPSIANAPSNGICRKSGFTNLGECEFEYPAGHPMRCNDWCIDLRLAPSEPRGRQQ
jgi:RimJ/RimL family protein N-acetyltransferase